ncbi:hypothetical protein QFC22_005798 [Naganishia vaughanmartiniae]|uniref:Uncharacterized protein n=1 Tax=Naganishia vaughanmartiniae TaxID=1424756 RepID=A0ACC2WQB7_9TREE|nr:hypothetical protein QFC22_005798 [Naganishia vaughanmartiniae]
MESEEKLQQTPGEPVRDESQLDDMKEDALRCVGPNTLKPILSRLPLSPSATITHNDIPQTTNSNALPVPLIEESGFFYTQARLPCVDQQDLYLWECLHKFCPARNEYGAAFKAVADQTASIVNEIHLVHPGPDIPCMIQQEQQCPKMRPTPKCPGFEEHASSYVFLIQHAFNWSTLPPLPSHIVRDYYGVLFRSTRHPPSQIRPLSSHSAHVATISVTPSLYAADREAHEEAVRSGGLLMYWYGEPDAQGHNVATCLWTGRDAARKASRLEKHQAAAGLAGKAYESYELVRYCVRKAAGETKVKIEAWED